MARKSRSAPGEGETSTEPQVVDTEDSPAAPQASRNAEAAGGQGRWEVNDRVVDMVRSELERNPSVGTRELFDRAKKLDKGIGELTLRQFHARYPLQLKRRNATGRPRRSRRRRREADREAIRTTLLELAKEIAGTEGRGELVEIVAGLDRYVERVVKATGAA
jgi:hypothetical protein